MSNQGHPQGHEVKNFEFKILSFGDVMHVYGLGFSEERRNLSSNFFERPESDKKGKSV